MIREVSVDEIKGEVGNFVLLWRKEQKTVAKIEAVESPDTNEKRIVFEVFSGQDKGKRFRARYDASQPVKVFDEDSLVLALLEV